MAIEYQVSTTHNVYPNLTVEEGFNPETPDTLIMYRVTANEGYVFKDTAEEPSLEYNPETGEDEPVTYYYRIAYLIPNFDFTNFSFVAVLESEVPADNIHGGNNHETA